MAMTPLGPFFLAVTIFLCVSALIFLQIRRNNRAAANQASGDKGSRLPPGPRPWPVLGNLVHLAFHLHCADGVFSGTKRSQPLHAALASLSTTYGPLVHLRLGYKHLVVACSADAAREVLRTHDRWFAGRSVPAAFRVPKYLENSMVWSDDEDPKWRRLRGLCRLELLGGARLDIQAGLRERKAEEMVGFLVQEATAGREIRIAEVVFQAVLEMFGLMVMSMDHMAGGLQGGAKGAVDWDLKKDFNRGLEFGGAPNLEEFFPSLFGGLDLQGIRKEVEGIIDRFYTGFQKIADQREVERRQLEEERQRRAQQHAAVEGARNDNIIDDDFLDVLLTSGLRGSQLHAFLEDLFTAGIDTTTTCVEWTMAELIKNPHVMNQLKNELNNIIGKSNDRYDNFQLMESQLLSFPYLQACIKESLRLHPPAPLLLPHRAKKTCNLMGYLIPKDSVVMVNAWAIGRDSKNWGPDALVFKPKRFVPESCQRDFKGLDFEFIPFSSGRRVCPGLTLANRIVGLLVASMVYYFEWNLPEGKEFTKVSMEEKPSIALDRKEPLVLVPSLVD